MIALSIMPSSYIRRAGIFAALIFALNQQGTGAAETPELSKPGSQDAIVEALRARDFNLAEKEARQRLAAHAQVSGTISPDEHAADAQAQQIPDEKRKNLLALATVLSARAWDADLRSRATRITGNDILLLIVLTLFAGGIVALLMKYGPQRPKVVEQTEQWMEAMQAKHRDDGFKQAGAAFYSLVILGLVAGGLFVILYLLMHLVAELDSPSREGANVRKLFNEAKLVMAQARDPGTPPMTFEDYDVLSLYADYLRKTGDPRQAVEVEKRIRAMQICGPGKLPQRNR